MIVDDTRIYVSAFVTNMNNGNVDAGMANLKHINEILRDHEVNMEAEAQEAID